MPNAEQLEHLVNALINVVATWTGALEAIGDVVAYGHVREQRVILIQDAQVALLNGQRVDIFAIEQDLSFVDGVCAGNRLHEHGLS